MEDGYRIWLPFELAPPHAFDFDATDELVLAGYPARLDHDGSLYTIRVGGLSSAEDASRLFDELHGALKWYGVHQKCGLTPITDVQDVGIDPDPKPASENPNLAGLAAQKGWEYVHAVADGRRAAILPPDSNVMIVRAASANRDHTKSQQRYRRMCHRL